MSFEAGKNAMGRPKGSRNEGYEEERARLERALLERLTEADGPNVSFREMARACDVTPPTLRHYFGGREGAIRAAIERAQRDGTEHLRATASSEMGPVDEALPALLRILLVAWRQFGVGDIMRFGLEVGLGDDELGPVYVENLLEPVLQSFEERLAMHIKRGDLRPSLDARYGALSLISPIVMGLLHQRELGGDQCRPLDIEQLVDTHCDAFIKTWAMPATA